MAMNNPAAPIAKTAIAGTFKCNNIAKIKKSEKEIRKVVAVLIRPWIVPLTNKIMGSPKRKTEPASGIKNAAKTNKEITGRNFKKGLPGTGILNFFKEDNLL
jgi:hypothetical protein